LPLRTAQELTEEGDRMRSQTQAHALARIYADLKALDSWHEVT